ncbi:MAG: hypothetical protein LBT97_00010 [Planctomycetota bacterium]|jgi:hypothetical protein|nr:hypothetical protein [Planctomycetota bacterium]
MITENAKIIAMIAGGVLCVAAAVGCCNTRTDLSAPPRKAPAYANRYRQVRGADGNLVYSIGSGATANSYAISLTGRCNPAPCEPSRNWPAPCENGTKVADKREPAGRRRDCPPTPPAIQAKFSATSAVAATPPAVAGCATAAGSYDWLVLGSVACDPTDALGACYTLTEEEAASGPTIYVPNAGSLDTLSGLSRADNDLVPENVEAASPKADVETAPPAKAAGKPVVETAPPSEMTAEAAKIPAIEPIVEPVAETAVETPGTEIQLPPPPADAASILPAETTEAPAAPIDMPPVFRKGATEAAAEEVLSRIGKVESIDALSPVELPPEL